jgi:hypothetical protein
MGNKKVELENQKEVHLKLDENAYAKQKFDLEMDDIKKN